MKVDCQKWCPQISAQGTIQDLSTARVDHGYASDLLSFRRRRSAGTLVLTGLLLECFLGR
jgi:hypothetical protein